MAKNKYGGGKHSHKAPAQQRQLRPGGQFIITTEHKTARGNTPPSLFCVLRTCNRSLIQPCRETLLYSQGKRLITQLVIAPYVIFGIGDIPTDRGHRDLF